MISRTIRWILSLAYRAPGANGGPSRVPALVILRHHRILADGARPLYRLGVAESVFREQLRMLARHGLAPTTVGEGVASLATGRAGLRVALSFDDGYRDNVERALPLLREFGARATFYLTAGLMEERRAPWWDVLAHALDRTRAAAVAADVAPGARPLPLGGAADRRRALDALLPTLRLAPAAQSERLATLRARLGVEDAAPCELATWEEAASLAPAGMEIGSHTLTHPFLALLPADAQSREIGEAGELIARRLGVRPAGVAYPGGSYDEASVAASRQAGLAHAVTTRAGVNLADAPRFELRRRGFTEGTCLGPGGRFSERLALAELDGAFDRLRPASREVGS